jgi:hypothetical protein
MNYRINTRIIAVVGLFALIATGLFMYTLVSAPAEEDVSTPQEQATENLDILITAKHQYREGTHTVVGTVGVPTRCHRLITEPFLLENGSVVEIRFTTLMEGAECPREEYDVPFKVPFEAREDVRIQATWDGVPVRLNLINVGPDESLDGDIYIKG